MSHVVSIENGQFVGDIAVTVRERFASRLSVELGEDDGRLVAEAITAAADLGMQRGATEAIASINEWWAGITREERAELSGVDPLLTQQVWPGGH